MADSTPTTQQVTQTGVPTYAQPYIEAMLGATQQQLFDIDEAGNIVGLKGYTPYSTDPSQYVAGFSPMQEQAFRGIAGLQTPSEYGTASQAVQQAMQQALGTSYSPTAFTSQYQRPESYTSGQFTPASVSSQTMNAPTMQTARTAYTPALQQFQMGPAQQVSAMNVGTPQMQAAQTTYKPELQTFQMGPAERVQTGAFTDKGIAQAYMSPYIQQALAPQLAEIQRQSDIAQQGLRGQAVASGAFGGSRQALQAAEQERNKQQLMSQATGQGYQNAYQQAMQQYGADAARQLAAQQANQAAGLTTAQQNLAAQLGVQQLGTQTGAQMAMANLNAAQQAAVQNQAAQLQAAGMNQQAALQAALANQQAGLTVGQQNLQSQLATQQLGTQAGLQTALANLNAEQQANVQNQAAQLQTQGLNAQQAMQAALANQQTGLTAQQLAEQSRQYGYGQQMTAAQQAAQYGTEAQRMAEQSRQYGAGLGMQGLGLGMTGAGQLANIGGAQFQNQLGILGAQQQAGALQQAQQQAIINQAIQNYQTAQQYPYQQLGFMSSMTRGLPMQDVTTQTYQATPDPLTQLAQLGVGLSGLSRAGVFGDTTGGGGGGGGGINWGNLGSGINNLWNAGKNIIGTVGGWLGFEEGGEVKKYADGGITSLDNKVRYNPTRYSDQQVQKSAQNNSLSGITALLALSDIAKAKENYARDQALKQSQQQGQGETILQQLAAAAGVEPGAGAAPEPVGIDQAEIDPRMFSAAGGGIVAFARGGDEGEEEDLSSMVNRQLAADPFSESAADPYADLRSLEDYFIQRRKELMPSTAREAYAKHLKETYAPEKTAADREKEMGWALAQAAFNAAAKAKPATGSRTRDIIGSLSTLGSEYVPLAADIEKRGKASTEAALRGAAELEKLERGDVEAGLKGAETMYGKKMERLIAAASKSNEMKDYVKMMTEASVLQGDTRPRQVIEAEHAQQFQKYKFDPRMLQAGAAAQQAGVAGTRAGTDIETAITTMEDKINKEYKTQILMAETPAEKARLEQERDAKIAQRAAEIRRGNAPAGAPAAAPKAAETPLPLPPKKEDLVTGKVYNTVRGPAKWNGSQFTPVQ